MQPSALQTGAANVGAINGLPRAAEEQGSKPRGESGGPRQKNPTALARLGLDWVSISGLA